MAESIPGVPSIAWSRAARVFAAGSSGRVDYFLLTGILLLSTYLLIGDIGVRLANTSSDDGLVAHAYFFAYPEIFARDAVWTGFAPAPLSSMVNWGPALALRYFGVPPIIFHVAVVYAQNVILGLAAYRIALIGANRSRAAGWLAALFVMTFRPHFWNLALYGDLDWMPYAGHASLALVLLGLSFSLQRRMAVSLLLLAAGGLCHPVIGLFGAATAGLYWLGLAMRERDLRSALRGTGGCIAVAVLAVAPTIFLTFGIQEVPREEILRMLLRNGHTVPWANSACGYCLIAFWTSILAISGICVLGATAVLASSATATRECRFLLGAALATAILGVAAHLLGYWVESVLLLRLIATRGTLVLAGVAIPLAVVCAWRHLQEGTWAQAAVAIYTLLAPSAPGLAGAALALLPKPANDAPSLLRGRAWPRVLRLAPIFLGYALVAFDASQRLPGLTNLMTQRLMLDPPWSSWFFQPASPASDRILGMALVGVVAGRMVLRYASRGLLRHLPISAGAIAIALAYVLIDFNASRGASATSGEARRYEEVQAWAREATAQDAAFIITDASIYYGWRNYTHRPVIATWYVGGVYLFPVSVVPYNERLSAAFATSLQISLGEVGAVLNTPVGYLDLYHRLNTDQLVSFGSLMGADYVVRRAAWPQLGLPAAFRNESYVVYQLNR